MAAWGGMPTTLAIELTLVRLVGPLYSARSLIMKSGSVVRSPAWTDNWFFFGGPMADRRRPTGIDRCHQ